MQNQSCSPSAFPPAFWEFVGRHRDDDVAKLRLKFHGKGEAWTDSAITHIECLKKCGKKFGSLQPRLMLSPLSVEQATSESVALLHASIAKRVAGNARLMLDMTCGMGIDLMAMQDALGCQAIGIEMNPHLASVTAYNFSDKRDVEILCDDSVAWLNRYDGVPIDLVFIDPARRGSAGQRVFNIHHCQPDVSVLMPVLEVKSRVVIVKLSPMLDVTQTLRDLPNTTELHLIDEGGECREMLAVIKMGQDAANTPPRVIIHSNGTDLDFTPEDEHASRCTFGVGDAGQWLFEPSPATMKAQPFGILCNRFNLVKLHPNTHLFFSNVPVGGMPGRWYEIEKVEEMSSSVLKTFGKCVEGADVAVRNFSMKAEELQKRIKVKPGGRHRIIGATVLEPDGSEKRLLFLLKKP